MASAHSAFSWIVPKTASGVIHKGHAVEYSSAGVVVESNAAGAYGIYVGDDDCADGDTVPICIGGPCKAWADGSTAIVEGYTLGVDSSGHLVKDVTATHPTIAFALENLASGTAMIEVCVMPGNPSV